MSTAEIHIERTKYIILRKLLRNSKIKLSTCTLGFRFKKNMHPRSLISFEIKVIEKVYTIDNLIRIFVV